MLLVDEILNILENRNDWMTRDDIFTEIKTRTGFKEILPWLVKLGGITTQKGNNNLLLYRFVTKYIAYADYCKMCGKREETRKLLSRTCGQCRMSQPQSIRRAKGMNSRKSLYVEFIEAIPINRLINAPDDIPKSYIDKYLQELKRIKKCEKEKVV